MSVVTIDGACLDLHAVSSVAHSGNPVAVAPGAMERVARARVFIDDMLRNGRAAYGVTTGFGKFSEVTISPDAAAELQRNLIRSHACGVGDPFDVPTVRAIMLLRANALVKGHSGVAPRTLQLLVDMINQGVHPIIPQQGSVGASGDLCPLAHLVLVMIGEGQASFHGEIMPGAEALHRAGLTPVELAAKEGLALINGTQMMAAVGSLTLSQALVLAKTADVVAALSWEALRGTDSAYDARIHDLRPFPGQNRVAANMRRLIAGSEIRSSHINCSKVQDAYSLRCIPQVHGASRDALDYVWKVFSTEINTVTDNPLVFPDDDEVLSGGNFHGQPLAISLDFLSIALAEWASISERRTERLVNPALSGLPAFLTPAGGLNSGMMIAQYTAAALVSENKVWAHPASVDSIPTSANQEDHVSMGSIAARKARLIGENLSKVLAIEAMAAAQGIDFLAPLKPGCGTHSAHQAIRQVVPRLEQDRVLSGDINRLNGLIASGELLRSVENQIGELD